MSIRTTNILTCLCFVLVSVLGYLLFTYSPGTLLHVYSGRCHVLVPGTISRTTGTRSRTTMDNVTTYCTTRSTTTYDIYVECHVCTPSMLFGLDSSPLVLIWADMKTYSVCPGSPTGMAVVLLQIAVDLLILKQDARPAQVLHPPNEQIPADQSLERTNKSGGRSGDNRPEPPGPAICSAIPPCRYGDLTCSNH